MKNIKRFTLITLTVLLWGSPCVGGVSQKETLRDIKMIGVSVEPTSGFFKLGLDEVIQMDVVSKLRTAGIRVFSSLADIKTPADKEWANSEASPSLYINVSLVFKSSYIVYHIRVAVEHGVNLLRKPDVICHASTWEEELTGMVENIYAKKSIREDVEYLVDKFLNDYFAVNPIQPSKPKGK